MLFTTPNTFYFDNVIKTELCYIVFLQAEKSSNFISFVLQPRRRISGSNNKTSSLLKKKSDVLYKVTVITGNKKNATTDARVSITCSFMVLEMPVL